MIMMMMTKQSFKCLRSSIKFLHSPSIAVTKLRIYLLRHSCISWKHIKSPLIWALYLCNNHTVQVGIDRKYGIKITISSCCKIVESNDLSPLKHGDEALAKYWKKRSKFIIQKPKSRYFINSLKQNRNNPKVLWKLLNDLNPKDEKEMTQFLNVNDHNLDNPIEIANAFNTHLTNIIEKIRQGSDPNTDIEISDTNAFLSSKLPDNNLLFQIPEIKPHEVFKSIQNLDEKKAKGLDDIGISFLKEGKCVITEPLTHIINQSINTGIFPDKWK